MAGSGWPRRSELQDGSYQVPDTLSMFSPTIRRYPVSVHESRLDDQADNYLLWAAACTGALIKPKHTYEVIDYEDDFDLQLLRS